MPSLMASVVIVIIGLIYYVWQAETQRIRLHELDQGGRRQQEKRLRCLYNHTFTIAKVLTRQ